MPAKLTTIKGGFLGRLTPTKERPEPRSSAVGRLRGVGKGSPRGPGRSRESKRSNA
jgi:hypothetical protein